MIQVWNYWASCNVFDQSEVYNGQIVGNTVPKGTCSPGREQSRRQAWVSCLSDYYSPLVKKGKLSQESWKEISVSFFCLSCICCSWICKPSVFCIFFCLFYLLINYFVLKSSIRIFFVALKLRVLFFIRYSFVDLARAEGPITFQSGKLLLQLIHRCMRRGYSSSLETWFKCLI